MEVLADVGELLGKLAEVRRLRRRHLGVWCSAFLMSFRGRVAITNAGTREEEGALIYCESRLLLHGPPMRAAGTFVRIFQNRTLRVQFPSNRCFCGILTAGIRSTRASEHPSTIVIRHPPYT
jgi:hypothetical protein